MSNDKRLSLAQVLEAHKGQPAIEKRFHQCKTVHELSPVLLHNEGRFEAFFFLYSLALLVQSLIERELRRAMRRDGIEKLPLYPEERRCKQPTAEQVLNLFALTQRNIVTRQGEAPEVFEAGFTDLQRQVLGLLGVPPRAYRVDA